jgi:bifunctional UDP-N-acetylglucosamine pyrophosphorylase/glucosamine-1-phosphate N-acetyltransferase
MTDRATTRPTIGVVLAAGRGTRMRSDLPKVLHPVAGRPMIHWVLDTLAAVGCSRTIVVVGHESDAVRDACSGRDLVWVEQTEQLGTGHALAQVAPQLSQRTTLLVVSGDVPLVSRGTLSRLVEASSVGWGSMAVADLDEPASLGRVLVREDGGLDRIIEAADAGEDELAIRTINAGLYALPAPEIFVQLARVGRDNAKGEIYLTDALVLAAAAGERVVLVELEDPAEAWGINDRAELASTHRLMIVRHLARLTEAGVTVLDPSRTEIEPGVQVGRDTVVHPSVSLTGETRVGERCVLHQGVWARDSRIDDDTTVEPYTVLDQASVGAGARIGPFARLRPGATVGDGAKVGNFVEMKNSILGAGSKASHLAYLGDTTVGEGANIGAGVITCNYDGVAKHPTEIGDGAFIGSDTMLVAPVRVGDGATTGAGSVISKDVPDGALAVERSAQRNIAGWAARGRRKRERDG